MAIQLTSEQELRIQEAVNAGAYSSAEEALEAAIAAVEIAATLGFEGTQGELDSLIAEGLSSGEPIEADDSYWNRLRAKTDRLVSEHKPRNLQR